MAYNLRACLEDVARKRGRLLNKPGGSAAGDYQEVWDCVNRYATSCLAAKKGINITNFCKIGYQLENNRGGGRTKYKPYFQLAEAFCKNYAIENKKGVPVAEKELSPFEECNFSKAAIKFSSNLSKDNVFCGLKYIVQAFGEAMSSGKRIEVDFEAGKLTVDNRRWSFEFKGEMYSREGNPVPADAVKNSNYNPSNSFQPPTQQAMKLKLEGQKAMSNYSSNISPGGPPNGADNSCGASEMQFSENNFGSENLLGPGPQMMSQGPPPNAPDDYEDSDMSGGSNSQTSEQSVYDPAKYKGPSIKQEKAHREAMDRYLTEMEIRASEAIADRRQWEDHLDRCLKQERNDLDRKRALAQENSDFIMQQIEWNRIKRNHDRKNFVATASAHEFPQFTEPDDAGLRKVMKERQRQMRDDLDLQVRTNNALKTIERNKERELEYAQLVANKNELVVQERKEAKAKDFEKSLLTDSWGRECRMKNIWRAIDTHTSAANQSGLSGNPLVDNDDDNVSVTSSQRGFSTRNRAPRMGASMSLEQQKARMGKK